MKGSIDTPFFDCHVTIGDVQSCSVSRTPPSGDIAGGVTITIELAGGWQARLFLTLEEAAHMSARLEQGEPYAGHANELANLASEIVAALKNTPKRSWAGRWRDAARIAIDRLRAKQLSLRQTNLFDRADASLAPGRRDPGTGG